MVNKKGYTLQQVPAVIIVLVVIGITVGLGQLVNLNFAETNCGSVSGTVWNDTVGACLGTDGVVAANNSAGYNVTLDAMSGLDDFSDFQPTIAIVVAAAVIIGIVTGALVMRNRM